MKRSHIIISYLLRSVYYLVGLVIISACTGPVTPAPVTDLTRPTAVMHGEHVVQPGETLFTIAWRYGRDYRALAAANNISAPYTIYPNQLISLETNSIPGPPPAQRPTQVARSTIEPSVVTSTRQPFVPTSSDDMPTMGQWPWPASGQVITQFSNNSNVNNGIDIEGVLGTPIYAAAPGEVVYSGDGLRGYGNLVIIRHNDELLSAYANNQTIEVQEGDIVKVGQKIAEMGRSGTQLVSLHFEIRRDGVPVDPLIYLAKD